MESKKVVQHVYLVGAKSIYPIIIVGCGGTMEDPNLSGFMSFAYEKLGTSDIPYFYLMKSGDTIPNLPMNAIPVCKADKANKAKIIQSKFRNSMSAPCLRPLFLSVFIEVWLSKEGRTNLTSTEELLSECIFGRRLLLRVKPYIHRRRNISEFLIKLLIRQSNGLNSIQRKSNFRRHTLAYYFQD